MKKSYYYSAVLLLSAFTVLSCSKDDNNLTDQSQIQQSIQTGTWRVTLYNDSGDNKTSYFNGYSFVFGSNSTVTATIGTITQAGTLSIFPDSGDTKFVLSFLVSTGPFEEISEDWKIVSQSAIKIELVNISGGNGGTDYLTFEKN